MKALNAKNKISTALAVILVVVLIIPCISIGMESLAEKITTAVELKQIDEFETQIKSFDGDAELRLIVKSSGNSSVDTLNASEVADGWNNFTYLQFENEAQLADALEYYNSLDSVEYAEREVLFEFCDDENLDPKCYGTANSNVDDALKLLDTYYTNLSEVRIGIIDCGVENSDIFGDRLVNGEDSLDDSSYHGSYVAGTLYYNTPENVTFYSYNAESSSGGSISSLLVVTSLSKAATQGCDVVNLSFGSTQNVTSVYNAIKSAYDKGVTIVAAAGNSAYDLDEYDYYPAEYSEVISVGNMSVNCVKYSSSNYNGDITTYATGVNVRSYYRDEEIYWSGTSASCPIVASIASMMISADSSLTPAEIKSIIDSTEDSPNENNTYRDMADAYEALSEVTGYELEYTDFDYTVTQNSSTGFCDIDFTCDEGTRIYYYVTTSGARVRPLNTDYFSEHYAWDGESTVSFSKRCYITVTAYSDNGRKSELYFIALPKHTSGDYSITASSGSIIYCSLEDSVIEVPETISSTEIVTIAKYSFSGMKNLETIILPSSVTTIGEFAFSNCTNLKKVIAPGVTSCSRYAFQNCTSLQEVIMPSVSETNTGMYRNCSSLLIAQMGDEDESLSTYNMAFRGSETAFNYKIKECAVFFDSFDSDGNIIYTDSSKEQTFTISAADALFLWNEYFINDSVYSADYYSTAIFDSTAVFDVNSDGYVNAKDYSLIYKNSV